MNFRFYFFLFSITAFLSCGNPDPSPQVPPDIKDKLMDANRILRQKESDEIDAYVKNQGWDMQMTGTGLRYLKLAEGDGDSARMGMKATINYRIKLLDGTLCYSSDSLGPEEFMVGRDYVETGLHEAIQMMRKGEKYVFILPSHLAHGLLGDWEKIPPLSPVVYYIELKSLGKK